MTVFQWDGQPSVQQESDLRPWLDALDGKLAKLGRAKTQLDWAKKWHEPYDAQLQDRIDAGYDQLYTEENHQVIETWRGKTSDAYLARWLDVLHWDFLLARIEQNPELRRFVNHISDRYVHWRPSLDGKEIPYTQQTLILRQEPDRDLRRKAWTAQWDLNEEIKEKTREMFQMRNEAARAQGFEDFAALQLAVDGVDKKWLRDLFGQMEQTTDPIYQDYLEEQLERLGLKEAEPWDIQFIFDRDPWPNPKYFQGEQLKDHLNECVRALGLTPESLGIDIYWYDSPYGGQCVPYDEGDIRILTNYGDGMLYYHTAYHEYGHALHYRFNEQPSSMQRESGMFSEGMAQLMALFLHYPTRLRLTGMPEDEVQEYRGTRKLPWMYRHRRIAADVMAELKAWEDPSADLDEAYGQSTARFLKSEYHPRPFSAVPRWTMPVRMQSYFIADLISCQTHAFLRREFSPLFGTSDAIEHLKKHYWIPGKSIDWLEKVERCTGEPLTYHYLGKEMTDLLPDG